MENNIELLRRLSEAFGPTGCEHEVKEIIAKELDGLCDEIYTDKLGNLIAIVRGAGQGRLMLSAHTDEVGFMVTHIDDDGMLKFDAVGIDARVLCGRRVVIGNDPKNGVPERTRVTGVIAAKPIHLQQGDEHSHSTKIEDMCVDIGAVDRADAEKYVSPGDYGTFVTEFKPLGGKYFMGKAVDDRFGCAVMCDTIKRLHDENVKPISDLYFAFTVREETGLSGARTAAFGINPNRAIVLEATAVADLAGVDESKRVAELGCGGAISLADNSTLYNTDFVKLALDTAAEHGIKCQVKRYVSGGNDAGAIHRTREGVPTLAISAPTRYLHSASTVFHADDYTAVKELIWCLIIK
jgi:Cellulase M and related proteins